MTDTDRARAEGVIEGLEMAGDLIVKMAKWRGILSPSIWKFSDHAAEGLYRLVAARRDELANTTTTKDTTND